MIRHILLWKYTDEVKNNHQEKEALIQLKQSVETLKAIDGLLQVEMDTNLESNAYDLVFYSEFKDMDALNAFKKHPLHLAHAKRCMKLVTSRLGADIESK